MRAAAFVEPYRVEVQNRSDPVIEEPTDAIVRVELAAICGSDLHPYRGNEVGLDSGTVMGHEFLGEVVAVGSGVSRIALGERVVSPFSTSCGACFYCAASLTARCERGELFGWVEAGRGLHGGQAELVRVPLADNTLLGIPDGIAAVPALFAGDILSTGLFAASSAGIDPGDVVVVVGSGPVGLMCVVAALEAMAKEVWAVDPLPERRGLATGFGATTAGPGDAAAGVAAATAARGADVVLEAVGTPEATKLAYSLVRPGGTIVAAGVHTESHFAISPGQAYDKNLTYAAGRSSARVFAPGALEIAGSGRYELDSIVSHTLPLDEAAAGYAMFDVKADSCTKVLLRP